MSKNVLLVNVDSIIPNLALMKLSAYHKVRGDNVGFNISDPDIVYSSIVFDWNKHKSDGLHMIYPDAVIDIGGQGYCLDKKIDIPEVYGGDLIKPDYSLYPHMDYDLGFTTRGCVRNCYFCNVCQLEGTFKVVQHPSEFHDPEHNNAVYLDNNVLLDKGWFMEVTDWAISAGMGVDFSQGFDIRLVDEDIAGRITDMKYWKSFKFAYDDKKYTDELVRGVELLYDSGFRFKNNAIVYVYMHNDDHFQDALDRCNLLREIGATPFVMINMNTKRTQRMIDLKRWCIPMAFWAYTFEEYQKYQGRVKIEGEYEYTDTLERFI